MCWQRDDYTEYESLPEWAQKTLAELRYVDLVAVKGELGAARSGIVDGYEPDQLGFRVGCE